MIVEVPVEVARKAAELAAAFVHPGRRACAGARRKIGLFDRLATATGSSDARAVALSALGGAE